jgi:hypothetical protein
MTQTIKERLELVRRPCPKEPEEAVYSRWVDYENQCNDADKFNAGVDACLPLLEAEYRQGFDDGMKHREFLICPCGCPMRIDAKDYQEKHSGEALTPNK